MEGTEAGGAGVEEGMEAVKVEEGGRVTLVRVPQPQPGPEEVLIRVRAVGICGTDVEICHGTMGYYTQGTSRKARYPVIPGHEWAGEIVGLGSEVKGDFHVGDHVVGETCLPCWQCSDCTSGNYQRCSERRETGIMNKDGGFAQYLTFPARMLHKVSKHVPFDTACVIEPLSVAVRAAKMSVSDGEFVVIFGDGSIGLLLVQAARAYGARQVLLVGNTPNRLARAKDMGADTIFDCSPTGRTDTTEAITQRLREVVLNMGAGKLADVIIEAAGHPSAFEMALPVVKDGGRITVLGVFGGQRAHVDMDQIVLRDLSIRGTVGSPGAWPETVALIESGKLQAGDIVTHRFRGLDRFEEALELVRTRADNVIKATILFSPTTDSI